MGLMSLYATSFKELSSQWITVAYEGRVDSTNLSCGFGFTGFTFHLGTFYNSIDGFYADWPPSEFAATTVADQATELKALSFPQCAEMGRNTKLFERTYLFILVFCAYNIVFTLKAFIAGSLTKSRVFWTS